MTAAGASLAPRWLPPVVAAAAAPAFLVVVKDTDLWWHMATGRWMVRNGRIPTTDPFTYTMEGRPWRHVGALADLVFYGVHEALGAAGLVGLKALAAFCVLTLVGFAVRELGARRAVVVASTLAAAVLLQARYTLDRPLVLGAVLLAATVLAALRCQRLRDRSYLFFLLALPAWPAVHASAPLGFAVAGSLLVSAVVEARRDPSARRRAGAIGATLLAATAISLALPWWRNTLVVAAELSGATATRFTGEWATTWEVLPDRAGHVALVLFAVAGGSLRARREPVALLLAIVAAAITARYARNAYEGVVLAMPGFAALLVELGAAIAARGRELLARVAPPAVALAIALGQVVLSPGRTVGGPFGFGVDRTHLPYDTLVTLRALPVHRLFNDFPIGGYLIWEDGPWGVYCDGRTVALFEEADVERLFVPMMRDVAALTRAADAWDAPYGLNQNHSPPSQLMMASREWIPVHLGVGTTLFVRDRVVGELPSDVRPLHLVRLTDDAGWNERFYAGIVASEPLRAELAEEIEAAARRGPESAALDDIVHAVAALDAGYADRLGAIVRRARTTRARAATPR